MKPYIVNLTNNLIAVRGIHGTTALIGLEDEPSEGVVKRLSFVYLELLQAEFDAPDMVAYATDGLDVAIVFIHVVPETPGCSQIEWEHRKLNLMGSELT